MLLEKVALTLLAVLAVQAQGNMYSRFKSTKIISSNPDVVEVHKCYIKAYSRNYSTFNLALTFKKPQVKPFRVRHKATKCPRKFYLKFEIFKVTIEIHYKYGTIYRTIFNQTIEWCTAAVGGDGASVLEKMVKGLIEDSAPALFHECPFYVIWLIY